MNINILNKQGFLSEEDRKEPLLHGCQYGSFYSCIDLSEPVRYVPYGNGSKIASERFSEDLAHFMIWWTETVFKDLNGFYGVKNFDFSELELI